MKVKGIIIISIFVLLFFTAPVCADLKIEGTSIINVPDTVFWSPVWSPDGKSIAYVAYSDSRKQEIFTINPDGSGKKQVTNSANKKWGLEWEQEGIFFISYDTDGLEKIFIIQEDGTGRKKLLDEKTRQGKHPDDDPPDIGSISKNPVTGKILLTSYDKMDNEKIYQVNPDGTGKKIIINDNFRQWNPSWSPDGQRIAYISYDNIYREQIFIVNSDGTGKKKLTSDDIKKSDPNWGPGGIIFVSYESKFSSGEQLFIIDPDNGEKKILLKEGFKQKNPRWNPDGSKIIYEEIELNGIKILKTINLQKPAVTITPVITGTPIVTSTPSITSVITDQPSVPVTTEPVEVVEEPRGTNKENNETGLSTILGTMLIVLIVVILLMLGMLLFSDVLSKK